MKNDLLDWNDYLTATEIESTPRETTKFAVDNIRHTISEKPYAIDIGCGTGRDTLFLLQNGYEVLFSRPPLSIRAPNYI